MKTSRLLFVLVFAGSIVAQNITISKDSLKVYNNPVSSFADEIQLVNQSASQVHLDSAFILFDEFDTTGFGLRGLVDRLQAQWKERNIPTAAYTYFNLEKIDGRYYSMKQRPSAVSNPVPLEFSEERDTLEVGMMEIGCLGCSALPTWYPPYLKGKMELRFSNGQKILIRLYSEDLRRPAGTEPCTNYQCDSMVVHTILAENGMADVSVGSFSSVTSGRISSVNLTYSLPAAVSLPKKLTKLSPEIGRLTALNHLYLSGNNLRVLPEEIGLLHDLLTLSVENNTLTTLPLSCVNLDKLYILLIEGNSICTLPDTLRAWVRSIDNSLSSRRIPVWPDSQKCGGTAVYDRKRSSLQSFSTTIRKITHENGVLTIETAIGAQSVNLFDVTGRIVAKGSVVAAKQGSLTFRMCKPSLRSGVYYVLVVTDKTVFHQTLIVTSSVR